MLHRGNNAKTQPGQQGAIPVELELAALDDLGPKTRFAICNAPLGTLAYAVIDQVIKRNDKIEAENILRAEQGLTQRPYIDPKDPRLDEFMAKHILSTNFQLLLKERSIEDAQAGIIPMRGRQSPKSLREQRRAERASRRMMR